MPECGLVKYGGCGCDLKACFKPLSSYLLPLVGFGSGETIAVLQHLSEVQSVVCKKNPKKHDQNGQDKMIYQLRQSQTPSDSITKFALTVCNMLL